MAQKAADKKKAEQEKINEMIAEKKAAKELKNKADEEERKRKLEEDTRLVNAKLSQRASKEAE